MSDTKPNLLYAALEAAHDEARKAADRARAAHVAALAEAEPLGIAASKALRPMIDKPGDFAISSAYARAKGLVDFAEAEKVRPAYAVMQAALTDRLTAFAPFDAAKRLRLAAAELVALGHDPTAILAEWAAYLPENDSKD